MHLIGSDGGAGGGGGGGSAQRVPTAVRRCWDFITTKTHPSVFLTVNY